ncbi:MAG: hypothetical protein JXA22_05250 [Candidatus Thermoplasmatota archaeon]|nr:hypothetical protein [Candidatus Thermoplasmatota archaeon]
MPGETGSGPLRSHSSSYWGLRLRTYTVIPRAMRTYDDDHKGQDVLFFLLFPFHRRYWFTFVPFDVLVAILRCPEMGACKERCPVEFSENGRPVRLGRRAVGDALYLDGHENSLDRVSVLVEDRHQRVLFPSIRNVFVILQFQIDPRA